MRGYLRISFCLELWVVVVGALPQAAPSTTVCCVATATSAQVGAPKTTTPPQLELVKRVDIASNVCGWVDGKSSEVASCETASATCLWNPALMLVGCGNSETFPQATACVDFTSGSSSSSADLNTQTCSSAAPYCATGHFPGSYSMFACDTAKDQQATIALTYADFPSPIPLPRNIGTDGSITILTQLPSSTQPVSTLHTTSGTTQMMCTTLPSSQKLVCTPVEEGNNNASIIAACIGGGVLLLGLPFGIKMIWRKWSWRQEERAPKQRTNPFGRQQAIPVEGPNFLFSQEWHGQQYGEAQRGKEGKKSKTKMKMGGLRGVLKSEGKSPYINH